MPRSIYILFVSVYQNKADIDDIVIARLKEFRYQPKRFQVFDIEESVDERGYTVYVYRGTYVGDYP